jgi:hypothetical protein
LLLASGFSPEVEQQALTVGLTARSKTGGNVGLSLHGFPAKLQGPLGPDKFEEVRSICVV